MKDVQRNKNWKNKCMDKAGQIEGIMSGGNKYFMNHN